MSYVTDIWALGPLGSDGNDVIGSFFELGHQLASVSSSAVHAPYSFSPKEPRLKQG